MSAAEELEKRLRENCIEGKFGIYTWDGADFCYDENPFCWDEVRFALRLGGRGKKWGWHRTYDELKEKEKEQLVTLVCKVAGYEETKETKKKIQANLTAEHMKMVVMEVLRRANITLK